MILSNHIAFEGLHNVRDLGGMAAACGRCVKPGMLYRSDQLFFATEGDLARLADMNVGVVFDFRSVPERDEKPDPAIAGARNLHLPIIEGTRIGITRSADDDENLATSMMRGGADEASVDRHMRQMYRSFVSEPFANGQYARFVDELIAAAAAGKAALWHCTAGKDRAGFATVIVLEALGVDRAVIAADYLQTNACLAETVDSLVEQFGARLPDDDARAALRKVFLADETYLDAAYDEMEQRFGTPAAFFERALGIDGAKRDRMRALFLA